MKVLLLTTCIYNEQNYDDLLRLINSIINQSKDISFEHGVLFQNYSNSNVLDLFSDEKYNITPYYISGIVSLSKARNYLINQYYDDIEMFDYISFPDDDCWYPKEFWPWFLRLTISSDFDLLYTKFSSKPVSPSVELVKHTPYKLVKHASSNTTFYKSSTVKQLKFFDEKFGVGSDNNGGEDTDYAIRASLLSKSILFSDSDLIGHRDPIAEFRYRYYKGSFGVLKKHCLSSSSLFLINVRKFLVGVVFLFCNKISITDFFIRKG